MYIILVKNKCESEVRSPGINIKRVMFWEMFLPCKWHDRHPVDTFSAAEWALLVIGDPSIRSIIHSFILAHNTLAMKYLAGGWCSLVLGKHILQWQQKLKTRQSQTHFKRIIIILLSIRPRSAQKLTSRMMSVCMSSPIQQSTFGSPIKQRICTVSLSFIVLSKCYDMKLKESYLTQDVKWEQIFNCKVIVCYRKVLWW